MAEGREIDELVRWLAGRRAMPSVADADQPGERDALTPQIDDQAQRGLPSPQEPTVVARWVSPRST